MLAGAVAGATLFRARPADMSTLRRRPGPVPEGWQRTPPSLLRYADEQTVAGTAAVFAAMETMGARPEEFEAWGVVAASRYLGRASLAAALRSFRVEGVWGTSPHLIPHFALHSPSGTISLALGVRGPNLGVGGGLHAAAEGFLAAMTRPPPPSAGVVPGVWLILERLVARTDPGPAGRRRFSVPDGRARNRARIRRRGPRMSRTGRGPAARRCEETGPAVGAGGGRR